MLYINLSESLIASFYYVHNALGQGLLELPYYNALLFIYVRRGLMLNIITRYQYFLRVNRLVIIMQTCFWKTRLLWKLSQ